MKLIIKRLKGSGIELPGSYFDIETKKTMCLTMDWFVMEKDQLGKAHKIQNHSFTDKVFEWTIDSEKINVLGERWDKIKNWFMRHDLMYCKTQSNPNSTQHFFEAIDRDQEIEHDHTSLLEEMAIRNEVMNMDLEGKVDLLYLLGGDAKEKKEKEIDIELLSKPGLAVSKKAEYHRYYKEAIGIKDREMTVVIKKAVALGIIAYNEGQYTLDQKIIGTNISQMIQYFNNEEGRYSYVKAEVTMRNINVHKTEEGEMEGKAVIYNGDIVRKQNELKGFEKLKGQINTNTYKAGMKKRQQEIDELIATELGRKG